MADQIYNPHLPHLATFTDPQQMAQIFTTYLPELSRSHSLTVHSCTIDKISYHPAKEKAEILYRLALVRDNGTHVDQWFYCQLVAAGQGAALAEEAYTRVSTTGSSINEHWQPVTFLPQFEALLWAFPYDPALSHLQQLVDEDFMREVIRQNRPALGLVPDAVIAHVTCKQVKYMPRRRCVLFLEVATHSATQGEQQVRLYSKTYGDTSSRTVFNIFAEVETALAGQNGAARNGSHAGQVRKLNFEVPKSLVHVDAVHTYWQEMWPGEPLDECYGTAEFDRLLPAAATLLATLHRSTVPQLTSASYIAKLPKEIRRNGEKIGDFLPHRRSEMLTLAETVAEAVSQHTQRHDIAPVPLHGTYRISQLMANGSRLALTDLDSMGLGDPHYDVAEFMATTLYQHVRRKLPLERLTTQAQHFQTLYQDAVPWQLRQEGINAIISASILRKLRQSLKGLEEAATAQIDTICQLAAQVEQGIS